KPARERGLCSAALRETPTASRRIRKIHSHRRSAAETRTDGALACAVRNHSPLSRRQWTDRAPDDRPPAGALGTLEGSASLSQPLLQASSRGILPTPQPRAARGRLGRLD